jgi:hypothetical protein
MGDERAYNTASFTYISYCDLVRIQILNWRQSPEFVKMWNLPINHVFSAVWFVAVVKPIAMVPVRFEPRPGTELPLWNCC